MAPMTETTTPDGGAWPFERERPSDAYRPGPGREKPPTETRPSGDAKPRTMLGVRVWWLDEDDIERVGGWQPASVNRSQAEAIAVKLYETCEEECHWVTIETLKGRVVATVEAKGQEHTVRWKQWHTGAVPMPDHLKRANRRKDGEDATDAEA